MSTFTKPVLLNETGLKIYNVLVGIKNAVEKANGGVIYGIRINPSESDPYERVQYIADAVGMTPAHMDYANDVFDYGTWENAFFMPRPCMVKSDGTVDYYLDPNDYSKKEDGVSASDVANTSYDGNAMMEWGQNGKLIWYKFVPEGADGTGVSIYIADYKADPDFKAYSFINKQGKLVDHFYTPCYFGSLIDNKLRSMSGVSGASRCKNKNTTAERTAALANNPTDVDVWDIETYSDNLLITILLWLMGKSTNTQAVFGQGLINSGSDAINDGFVSGQHNDKGLFYGTNSGASATYTNAVKVFGMENFWGYMWRRELGYMNVTGTLKYKMCYGQSDGSTVDDYVVSTTGSAYDGYKSGEALPAASGSYIKEMVFNKESMTPTDVTGGSAATYYADGLWTNLNAVCLSYHGGHSFHGLPCGAACRGLNGTASTAYWTLGAAPSLKPLFREG